MSDFENRLRSGLAAIDDDYTPGPDRTSTILRRTRQREQKRRIGAAVGGLAAAIGVVLAVTSALGLTARNATTRDEAVGGSRNSSPLISSAPSGVGPSGTAPSPLPSMGLTEPPSASSGPPASSVGAPRSILPEAPASPSVASDQRGFPTSFPALPGKLPPPVTLPPVTDTLPPTTDTLAPPTTVPPTSAPPTTDTTAPPSTDTTATTCPAPTSSTSTTTSRC